MHKKGILTDLPISKTKGVVNLLIKTCNPDTYYNQYYGYYGYYYADHAMLLIETFESKRRGQGKVVRYLSDFIPPNSSLSESSVRVELVATESKEVFVNDNRIDSSNVSAWGMSTEIIETLVNNLYAQTPNSIPGITKVLPPKFCLRGSKSIGMFWQSHDVHNCITWAQLQLEQVGIAAVNKKCWLLDKIAVQPKNHIGYIGQVSWHT